MKKFLLLSFSVFICHLCSIAQTLSGGEIYYEYMGNKTFRVKVHVYRQCEDNALSGIDGYVIADTFRIPISFSRINISKINDTCGNPCNKQNTISNPGMEKHSFEGLVDFKNKNYKVFVDSGLCFVHFAIYQSGRDPRATTHDPGMFYIDAGVDICLTGVGNNHSPIFTMDPKFYAPCNTSLSYSPGPLDTADHDSLVFSLESVQTNFNEDIAYAPGYSGQIPLTPYCPPNPGVTNCRDLPNAKPPRGFHFDPTLCQIFTTPTRCNEFGYIRFKIKEYRRINNQMELLGYTCREMLLQTKTMSGNSAPVITITGGPNISLCSSPALVLLKTEDEVAVPFQSDVDTTHIYWDNGYIKGNITVYDTVREKSAQIELDYDPDLIGKKQYFTISYNDRTCNAWTSTRTFSVMNTPPLEFNKTTSLDSCNIFNYSVKTKDNQTVLNTSASILDENNKFIASVNQNSNFTFNSNGRYYVRYNIQAPGNVCQRVVFDTLNISNSLPLPVFNINQDTAVCQTYPATLTFKPSLIPNLQNITWYLNNNQILSGDSTYSTSIDQFSSFNIVVEDQRGCKASKTINFSIKSVNVNMVPDNAAYACYYSNQMVVSNIGFTMKKPVTYRWVAYGDTFTQSNDTFRYQLKGNNMFKVWMKDVNHCIEEDSIQVASYPLISFKLQNNKSTNCIDSLGMFVVTQLNTSPLQTRWMNVGYDTANAFSFVYYPRIKGNTFVKLRVTDNNSCSVTDSIPLVAVPRPFITLVASDSICPGSSTVINAVVNNKTLQYSHTWYLNNVKLDTTGNFIPFKGNSQGTFRLRAGNDNACFSEAEKTINIFPKRPALKIQTDTFYNPLHHISLKADPGYSSYLWFNGDNTSNSDFWAYELGAPGKYTVWCRVLDENDCENGDTLDIFTDRKLSVSDQNNLNSILKAFPNPAQTELFVEVSESMEFQILAVDGKTVISGIFTEGLNRLILEQLESGLYMIQTAKGSIKFIKN